MFFDISGLPGTVSWTWGVDQILLRLPSYKGRLAEPEQSHAWQLPNRDIIHGLCHGVPTTEACSNYLTLENEILTSFLPFFHLVRKIWVDSQEGYFPLNSASVQITAHTADSQKNFLQRTWGWKQHHTGWVREPLASSIFCSVFV